jgi:hypothetical protein
VLVGTLVATVLGLATLVRVVAHSLGYSALHPDSHPLDVEYGFDVRFCVLEDSSGREPDVDDILAVSLTLSALASGVAAYMWLAGAWGYPPAVMSFLGANWLLVIADPAICLGSYAWDSRDR